MGIRVDTSAGHVDMAALEDLRRAAELLEVGDALCEVDRGWRIVRVNRNQEMLLGKPRTETLGRELWEVWPANPTTPCWRALHRAIEERIPVQLEEYFPPPRDLWTSITAYPVSGGGIAIFFRDVTADRRRRDAARARAEEALRESEARAHGIAENALRESEARLRAVFEDVAVGIVEVDEEDRFVAVNGRLCQMLGYRREELLGRSIHEITAPEDRERTRDLNARGHRGELRMFDYEKRYLKRDGSPLWVHVTVSVVTNAAGRFRAVGTVEDIADRRRAEEEAHSLAQFPKENPNPVLRASIDGRVLYANDPARRVLETFGWTEGSDLPDALLDAVRQVPVRGTILAHEVTGAGGEVWSFSLSASAGEGHVNLFGRDITASRQAQDKLRLSEERLREYAEVLDHAPVLVRDAGDRVVIWNRGMERLYGWTREVALGKVSHELFETRFPAPLEEIRAQLDREGSWQGELRHRRADGAELIVMSRWFVRRDPTGALRSVIEVDTDVTDLNRAREEIREANERLREADRRKDEFLGMLSHELRNPLAPIRNSLYILDRTGAPSPQAVRAREVASRQVTHMTRLVDDLLDVTRIARGKIELRRSDVDLAALAQRTGDDHRAIIRDRRLDLEVRVPDAPVIVNGDETRIAQVIGNLLHNAAKFTPGGGRITLAVGVEGGKAAVRVRDTGAGIAPDVLPTVFEAFTQAKQTIARSEGGLGLGLALVKGLVILHGGDVQAYSAGQGHGAEFVVTLPVATAPTVTSGPRPPAPTTALERGRHVLIIDDNHDAAETLGQIVQMLGHEVDVAYDAYDGLAKASKVPPDVVLCDIGLPGMDGYEAARRLRALEGCHRVRLVALSGYAQPEDVARAIEAGFDAHVAKPPDPEQLAGLLS